MHENYQVFFSNRVEILYAYFKYSLYQGTSPFSKRLLIVPSPAMKTWLTLRLAEDLDLQIATGFEIYTLEDGLDAARMLTSASTQEQILPSALELALKIETELRAVARSFDKLSEKQQHLWRPLMDYLHVRAGQPLSKKSMRRLTQLSDKLAHHFKQYGRYGAEMLAAWERQPEQHWQASLWKRIFGQLWSYPYKVYTEHQPSSPKTPVQCHLFAISYITVLQQRLLQKLASSCQINHYLLSPCALFWSDVRSDKERVRILKFQKENEQLDETLRERNPLLANFGRLGREMAKQIEESGALSAESYIVSQAILEHAPYQEFLDENLFKDPTHPRLTLLHAIQADMVLLRNPIDAPLIELPQDPSLQLHAAPNRMREVEILYDNILRFIDQHQTTATPITPKDVIVLTPDIAEYEPYIKAVFGQQDSQLDCQIMDLKIPAQGRLIQAFLHLIHLPLSHWDAKAILQLFTFPAFQRKHHLSTDQIETLRDWIKRSGIHWGDDASHRNALLQRDHCTHTLIGKGEAGTWNHGLNRLIQSLVLTKDETANLLDDLPIYRSQSGLLDQCIFLLRSLKEDIQPLMDDSALTMEHWALYLECLLNSYFAVDPQERSELAEKETLLKQIHSLRSGAQTIKEETFTFESVKYHLEASLYKEQVCYRENHLQAVKFCSMLPMRAFPARVVALLGMQEGAYPKKDTNTTLNAMTKEAGVDYCPSQTDYDRYLFLEILLSARDALLISYSALSASEDQEAPPSLLVTELFAYLDRSYLMDGKKPSEACVYKHPFFSFDKRYFDTSTFLKSYSQAHFKAAQTFYQTPPTDSYQFIPSFSIETPAPRLDAPDVCIDLKDLSATIKNPIKSYFNTTLQIYLKEDEARDIPVEENFYLPHLDLYKIKKAALHHPLDSLLTLAENQELLPEGLFKEVALNKIFKKTAPIRNLLNSLEIRTDDFFDIELSEQCLEPKQLDNGSWVVPSIPISLDDQTVHLTGRLTEVTSKGLVILEKKEFKGYIHHLPKYAALHYLIDRYHLPIECQLIPIEADLSSIKKELPETPEELLKKIVDYYQICLKNPSPLIKEWIKHVMDKDPNALQKAIDQSINNDFVAFYNTYMRWVIDPQKLPEAQKIFDVWEKHAIHVFGMTYAAWETPKKQGTAS